MPIFLSLEIFGLEALNHHVRSLISLKLPCFEEAQVNHAERHWEGGKEGRKEGWKEGRERGREGEKEEGRKRGREGGRSHPAEALGMAEQTSHPHCPVEYLVPDNKITIFYYDKLF